VRKFVGDVADDSQCSVRRDEKEMTMRTAHQIDYAVLGAQPIDYAVLGDLVARELELAESGIVGDDAGLSAGYGLSSLAELASRGLKTYEDKKAGDEKKSKSEAAAKKAIAADASWASAEATLEQAQSTKVPTAIEAAQAMQSSAMSAAMAAGIGLDEDAQAKRLAAATDASNKAAATSLANPSDKAKAAAMHGWQKVLATATSGASPTAKEEAKKIKSSGSWWTRRSAGVPNWGWVAGGTLLAAGVGLGIRAFVKRR
jgi:hypothetical protein